MRLRMICALMLFFGTMPLCHAGWIQNLTGLMKRDAPKYQNIHFWDEETERYRGIRAFLYVIPQDEKNRMVDRRLYDRMAVFMNSMCSDVVTIDSFSDPVQMRIVEEALVKLTDQWKKNARIDPKEFFAALPFIDVDVVALMERSHYDPIWKDDKKRLMIGLNVGVFEMDMGAPMYLDRVMADVEWFGERASYAKAEHAALLQVADLIGEKFMAESKIINERHEMETAQLAMEQKALAAQTQLGRKEEFRLYQTFAKNAEIFFRDKTQPKEITDSVRAKIAQLNALLAAHKPDSPMEEHEKLRAAAGALQQDIIRYDAWVRSQTAAIQKQAADEIQRKEQTIKMPVLPGNAQLQSRLDQPSRVIAPPTGTVNARPLPKAAVPTRNFEDRSWLLPGKTSGETISTESIQE